MTHIIWVNMSHIIYNVHMIHDIDLLVRISLMMIHHDTIMTWFRHQTSCSWPRTSIKIMIGVTKPRNWNGHDMLDFLKCEMIKMLGKAFSEPGRKQSFITEKLLDLCGDQKSNRSQKKTENDQSASHQDWFK